jgi:phospholipase C
MRGFLFFILIIASTQLFSHSTTTPIKHLVVIFQENRTFDHFFGTYPHAENNPGEPRFTASSHTPTLDAYSGSLLNMFDFKKRQDRTLILNPKNGTLARKN